MTIAGFDLHLLRLPLKTPYHLAFGDVRHFDTIVVEVRDGGGREGLGEATLLAAYGGEAPADAWAFTKARAGALVGMDGTAAEYALAPQLGDHPFTVTALTAAIEMLEGHPTLRPGTDEARVPILGPVNAADAAAAREETERLIEEGYGTLKVKVGFEIEADMARVHAVQEAAAGRALIRIDGNQGYGVDDACRFAAGIDPVGIELFEQPCDAADWAAAKAVAEAARVPMMLDESIFTVADIERSAETGAAAFIKLKLSKMGGLRRLSAGLERIRQLGMEPVLGNGVAADVGCWMEARAAAGAIANAGEFNGFLRPVESLLAEPLRVERGAIVIPAGFTPALDRETLARYSVARERIGPTAVAAGSGAG